MADVSQKDRGQLLLVGALTLAVTLVALAVLLNAAIYTGNVATRDAGPGSDEAIEFKLEASVMVHSTMNDLNARENESYANLRQNFTATVSDWETAMRTHSSSSLAAATVENFSDPTSGTTVRQQEPRNFTSANRGANWTVANDSTVRAFRMNISQDSLASPDDIVNGFVGDDSPTYYSVEFDDNTTSYTAQVRATNGSEAIVRVLDSSGSQVESDCQVTPDDDWLWINITSAHVGGEDCPALEQLFDGLGDRYTISYANSENVNGTYSLVVDRPLDQLETGAATDGTPTATQALYSAEFRLTYRSADVQYESDLRIAPGETDD